MATKNNTSNSDGRAINRRRVFEVLGDSVLVLKAWDMMQQTNDCPAPYVPEMNFYWLTGIDEPGWVLVMDGRDKTAMLYAPDHDEIYHVFNGAITTTQAQMASGIQDIKSIDTFQPSLHHGREVYTLHPTEQRDFAPNPTTAELQALFPGSGDARKLLTPLRAIKQPHEIDALRRSIDLTIAAYDHAREILPYLQTEAELQAEFDYMFARAGAKHAYEPIVAAGKHACTLHYVKNNAPLLDGSASMVLLDIGARVDGMAADISRTWAIPSSGEPTERQRAVHRAVLDAQRDIIQKLAPGLGVKEYIEYVDTRMWQALCELGLGEGEIDTKVLRTYMPHSVSHGLGLDVHESLGAPQEFAPGMVVTVEPGIYIPAENIGVRIEDDILILETGRENLSEKLSTDL